MTARNDRKSIGIQIAVCALLVGAIATPCRADPKISQIAPGIYRGGQLRTAADYQQLRRHGIKSVIDLRQFRRIAMAREARRLAAMGINYYAIPVSVRPWRDGSADRALRAVLNPQLQPVYVHCNLGKDRVGLVTALYRVRYQGWSRADADREMQQLAGRRILPSMRRYLWDSPQIAVRRPTQPTPQAPNVTVPGAIETVRRPYPARRY